MPATLLTRLRPLAVVATLLAGGWAAAAPAGLLIDGAVDRPATLSADELARLPQVTQTASFAVGSAAPQGHSYTGPLLWSLLDRQGLQLAPGMRSGVLTRYVLATGRDGYKAVFTLGELSPDFGHKQALVALDAQDGSLRVTAPGDVKGGRYVALLDHLTVRVAESTATAAPGGGVSPSFAVSGAVLRPRSFDLAALQALPATTLTGAGTRYTGVSLFTLLDQSTGIDTGGRKNAQLAMYAVATGSDGYQALVSLGEIDPGFGNRGALIAWQAGDSDLGKRGVARLVVDGDVKQGRSVSNLAAIEVFAAPAATMPTSFPPSTSTP